MGIPGITVHTAVLTALVWIQRIFQPYIGTGNLIDNGLRKSINKAGTGIESLLPFQFTMIQKIIPQFMGMQGEPVCHLVLGTSSFYCCSFFHRTANIGYIPNKRMLSYGKIP